MAIVYTIQPNPHWVIIDNFSKLPAGAAIYTYRSLDPEEFKPAFEDAEGLIPYGQPIVGFGNGTMPPIFWEFDDTNPDELYYIRVYDSDDPATQTFLWDFDGISGAGTGGGGSPTINNNTKNLIANNIFYRNIGDTSSSSVPTFLTLAPSNNAGYVGNLSDTNGPASPDIIFAKANTSATDAIKFPAFTPIGINDLGTTPTPTNYLNYTCTVAGASETYKYFQFPIVQGLQALSGQTISLKVYSRWNTGENGVTVTLRQFFGNGGAPSADVVTAVGTLSYPGAGVWDQTSFTSVTIPSIAGKTLGTCGNDGLFLQINIPVSGTGLCNLDFIKPAVYLGTSADVTDFNNYDMVDSIIALPRTGDVRTSLNSFNPYGWVTMNDGTIGNKNNSGNSNATTRSNVDTFPLFDLIWNTFHASQTLAPMFDNTGVPVAYGANSFADFDAYRQISLTKNLGRIMAGALPVNVSQSFTNTSNVMTVSSTASFYTGMAVTVTGGSLPTPLIANTIYYAIVLSSTTMSLAASTANAINPTPVPIALTSNASGTVSTINIETIGSYIGEERHIPMIAEMAAHTHPGSTGGQSAVSGSSNSCIQGNTISASTQALTIASQGGGVAFNIIQATVYMNIFIKL